MSKELIEAYINAWLNKDIQQFSKLLTDEVRIEECYGATYGNLEEACQWFEEWNQKGSVLKWQILDYYFDEKKQTAFATWIFHCEYKGELTSFEGISLIEIKDNKISTLKEYEMSLKKYRPFQKNEKQNC